MSVYKPAKSRFWHYDFQAKGRRFHGSTGVETRRKAEAVERALRGRVALGESLEDTPTLHEAASKWWLEVGQHLATADTAARRIEIVLRLIGKATPLTEISTKVVNRAIEKRRAETFTKAPDKPGKPARRYPVANATVNADIIITLSRILNRARKTWEVKGLPEIDWRSLRLEEPPPKVQWYTRPQREAWLAQCDPTAAEALQILLTYGLRFSELFFPPEAFDPGLGIGDDGEDLPMLILQKRKAKNPKVIELRADDARRIAARAGRARAAGLPSIWFEQEAPAPALAKVTRGRHGDPAQPRLIPVTYYGLQARLNSAARRAGIDGGRLIHGARHHAGTESLRRSKNLKLTQALLGHKDIKSTLRYAHALQGDLRQLVESESRAEALLDQPFEIPTARRTRRLCT